jgi:hypothetical protein
MDHEASGATTEPMSDFLYEILDPAVEEEEEEFEILYPAVEEESEILNPAAEEEEPLDVELDEHVASPPATQLSETAEPPFDAHHGRSFGKSPRQMARRTPSNLAFDECVENELEDCTQRNTRRDAIAAEAMQLVVKACGDARAAYQADDLSATNY